MSTLATLLMLFPFWIQVSAEKVQKDWDYITFNQQWIPAVCNDPEKQHCNIPKNLSTWTIHGVWPDQLSPGLGDVTFCNKSWPFNISELQPIREEMNMKWPSDEETYPNFWKHEWEKHGTCAASLQALNTIEKYFSEGLLLHAVYDITKVLNESGFIPDSKREIKVTDIEQSLSLAFGKKAKLQCITIKGAKYLLSAIEVCLDKELKAMDCPTEGNCRNETLIYPPPPGSQYEKVVVDFDFSSFH